MHASDITIQSGSPIMVEVYGRLIHITSRKFSNTEVAEMINSIYGQNATTQLLSGRDIDTHYEFRPTRGERFRFRVNATSCLVDGHDAIQITLRTIPTTPPPLSSMDLPEDILAAISPQEGIVFVTGATGSGKSTTLAAMVNHINENEQAHILTIEDPIEFVHISNKCLINQRELGPHTHSFAAALRSALREDPDVILVGELRDLETIRLALTAAETGHLVFGTLHTASASKTIDRIIDVFPGDEKEMVRAMLSESLQAVISQTLLKNSEGTGRIAAHEIMLGTPAIRNLIREAKVAQMYSTIQTGSAVGMQTLDACLTDLVRRRRINLDAARAAAKTPENFH
jgi:twitching motility protein PilT